jgi:hypothetical protein
MVQFIYPPTVNNNVEKLLTIMSILSSKNMIKLKENEKAKMQGIRSFDFQGF